MPKFPAPNAEGHYWAKLVRPSKMPVGEDWRSVHYEVVQVFCNNGEDDEAFMVHVPGIAPSQNVNDFVWGPVVPEWRP